MTATRRWLPLVLACTLFGPAAVAAPEVTLVCPEGFYGATVAGRCMKRLPGFRLYADVPDIREAVALDCGGDAHAVKGGLHCSGWGHLFPGAGEAELDEYFDFRLPPLASRPGKKKPLTLRRLPGRAGLVVIVGHAGTRHTRPALAEAVSLEKSGVPGLSLLGVYAPAEQGDRLAGGRADDFAPLPVAWDRFRVVVRRSHAQHQTTLLALNSKGVVVAISSWTKSGDLERFINRAFPVAAQSGALRNR